MKMHKLISALSAAALLLGTAGSIPASAAVDPPASEALSEFYTRIAGWDGVTPADCYLLDNVFLTPKKVYEIDRVRFSPYRVFLKEGTTLDTDEVGKKWKEMLLADGYPAERLENHSVGCTLMESEGGYQVYLDGYLQESYRTVTLADCLKTFPQVQMIDAQFGYWTHGRINATGSYCFAFNCDRTLTPEDFPQLSNVTISDQYYQSQTTDGRCYLRIENPENVGLVEFDSLTYADYFAAIPYLLSLDYVHDLSLSYMMTELADESDDAQILEKEPDTLFLRGDVSDDGELTVSDAVFSARLIAEDKTLTLNEAGLDAADMDANGLLDLDDLVMLLKQLGGQIS